MPRFRLRSILALTALTAIALLFLVKPTNVWLVLWPFLASGLCVFVFVRTVSIRRETMFWASFVVGVTALLMMAGFIELTAALVGDQRPEIPGAVGAWVWELIHREAVETRNTPPEFVSFVVSLHIIVAMVWSAVVTFVAQLLFGQRNKP